MKRFEIQVSEGDTTRSWNTEIVTSQNEVSFLPRSLKQGASTAYGDVGDTRNYIADTVLGSWGSKAMRCEEQPRGGAAEAAGATAQKRYLLVTGLYVLSLPV